MPDARRFSPACILQDLEKYLGDQMDYTELQAIWGMNLEKMEENDVRVLAKECEKKRLNRIFCHLRYRGLYS